MTPVGYEPTRLALVDPESTPLNHLGKVSWWKRLRLQNRWDVAYMYYINENVYLIAAEFLGNSFVHQDSLAERSKAVAQGAIPQGRGLEPHSCHYFKTSIDRFLFASSQYTWPGSNWRPSACEADVIATRPQVRIHFYIQRAQSVLKSLGQIFL